MLCDNCKERDAIINLTQVEHDSKVTLHLCEQCAQQKGVETGGAVLKSPLGNFLGAVVKGGGGGALVPAAGDTLRCPACGSTLRDFRDSGRLGCDQCYASFDAHLRDLLRRLHGSSQHVGERYVAPGAGGGGGWGWRRCRSAQPLARAQGPAPPCRRGRKLRARGRAPRPHPGARVMDLTLLPDGGMRWLDASGPKSTIVLSTRIRLARNVRGIPFSQRAKDTDRTAVLERVTEAAAATDHLASAVAFRLDLMERPERQLLHERHLVSKELAGLEREARPRPGAALLVQDQVGVMVNEEDHLRLHGMWSGFDLEDAYAAVETVDAELGKLVPFAFHPEFGYLTSCPTNAGTGLRASVLIHLPGLVLTKEINKVLQGLSQVGLTFRGLYGEGSEVVGNFFQLSNQTTLGKTEDELIDHLGKIVRQVVEYEEQARDVLLRTAPEEVEDKTWRAYGLLKHARRLSFEETMNLLSGVRLGVSLKLLPGPGVYTLNKLLIYTQPAHLAAMDGRSAGDRELPTVRAAFVRRLLEAESS